MSCITDRKCETCGEVLEHDEGVFFCPDCESKPDPLERVLSAAAIAVSRDRDEGPRVLVSEALSELADALEAYDRETVDGGAQ